MKNLVTLLLLMFSFTLGTAQHKTSHSQGVKKETKKKHHSKQKSSTTYSSQKLKKDGTPDRRYKTNKKLKKDGTPDKRYKENK